jgi:hypothetical protein
VTSCCCRKHCLHTSSEIPESQVMPTTIKVTLKCCPSWASMNVACYTREQFWHYECK